MELKNKEITIKISHKDLFFKMMEEYNRVYKTDFFIIDYDCENACIKIGYKNTKNEHFFKLGAQYGYYIRHLINRKEITSL